MFHCETINISKCAPCFTIVENVDAKCKSPNNVTGAWSEINDQSIVCYLQKLNCCHYQTYFICFVRNTNV